MGFFLFSAAGVALREIMRLRNDVLTEELQKTILSGDMRTKYPNFAKAFKAVFYLQPTLVCDYKKILSYHTSADDGNFWFRLFDPETIEGKPCLELECRDLNGITFTTEKLFLNSEKDLNIDVYIALLNKLIKELNHKRGIK